jgi:hypothetical protein
MRKLFIFIFLLSYFFCSNAQDSIIYQGVFKKGKIAKTGMAMSSNQYKPDKWEKSYYDSSLKTAFPSDLIKHSEKYLEKLIHLIGIVDSVYIDSSKSVTFRLENKYWDYIEDYSIQDEKMFVSEKGDGKFLVTLSNISFEQFENFKKFPAEKKLFLTYGIFKGLANGLPVLSSRQIKYIDYELYTTKVFSYEILRNKNGDVVIDKKGEVQMTNLRFLKVAKAGQNK